MWSSTCKKEGGRERKMFSLIVDDTFPPQFLMACFILPPNCEQEESDATNSDQYFCLATRQQLIRTVMHSAYSVIIGPSEVHSEI